jgi:hypothetical protein
MPDEGRMDHIEKLLSDQKALEHRKETLIADLLKQREIAIKQFDEKLAKLGYQANSGKSRRSHHKQAASRDAAPKPAAKTNT